MKGIIYKDWVLIRRWFFITLAVLGVFAAFTATGAKPISIFILPVISLFFAYMNIMMIVGNEEKEETMIFILSTPVDKKKYVKSKYAESFLIVMIGSIITIAGVIKSMSGNILLPIFVISMFLPIVFLSIILPVTLKFGLMKARYIMVFSYLLIIFALNSGKDNLLASFRSILDLKISLDFISATVMIIAFILYYISFKISIKVMKGKEY